MIKEEGKTSRVISEAYAKATGKAFDVARNNISNALARLKDAGKVGSKPISGTNEFIWFTIE